MCDAVALLWDKLAAGGDEIEIEGAEVTGDHVAEVLSRGMARYCDGPRDSLAAMGKCIYVQGLCGLGLRVEGLGVWRDSFGLISVYTPMRTHKHLRHVQVWA